MAQVTAYTQIMHEEQQLCILCGEPETFKARVQLFAWRYACIWLCKACKPYLMDAITKAREFMV